MLKTPGCYISTPEYLRTFKGRWLKICQGKGELRLDSDVLSFQSGWQIVTIPLSSIRTLAQGHYPLTAKPLPLNFIGVTFDQRGTTRTLLFTPFEREMVSVLKTNKVVGQWFSALREAIGNSTGRSVPVESLDFEVEGFWKGMLKHFCLAALFMAPIYILVSVVFFPRLGNLWVWLLSSIFTVIFTAAFATGIIFAVRWRHSRSAWKAAARPLHNEQHPSRQAAKL
jgi:hypothetical protein